MSMKDLWLRQSVHGWVLFLGIKSVYTTKVKEITEASASVGLLLATAVHGILSWTIASNRTYSILSGIF